MTYLSCRRLPPVPTSNPHVRITSRVADMAGVVERPSGGGDDAEGNYPVGFRFKPTLRELVEFYLLPKLLDKPTVPNDAVIEADAYECHPEILTSKHHLTWSPLLINPPAVLFLLQ